MKHLPSIDLRSDTVTQPTPAMQRAMMAAPLGDDVFGDDPTALALEAEAAKRFGKEAALFVPSGTMANQIAIQAYCAPGAQALVPDGSHSIEFESGAAAALSGVQLTRLRKSIFGADDLEKFDTGRDAFYACPTSLVIVENTHNMAGGITFPLENLIEIHTWCQSRALPIHMDGARLFNASVATGIAPKTYAQSVDSLTFCLSKGLGCPVGSVLVGRQDFIQRARHIRKRLGGAMRQIGLLCGAGLYALEHHIERLADDHRRAKDLAAAWDKLPGLSVPVPETNLVYIDLHTSDIDGATLCQRLSDKGIRILPISEQRLRAVLHLGIDDADIKRAQDAMAEIMLGL